MDGPDGTIRNKMGDIFLGGSGQGTLFTNVSTVGHDHLDQKGRCLQFTADCTLGQTMRAGRDP